SVVLKLSLARSRGLLAIAEGCAERRTSAVGRTSLTCAKPQRIAGNVRQLARVTWAFGAAGQPRMISLGRIIRSPLALPAQDRGTDCARMRLQRYRDTAIIPGQGARFASAEG